MTAESSGGAPVSDRGQSAAEFQEMYYAIIITAGREPTETRYRSYA